MQQPDIRVPPQHVPGPPRRADIWERVTFYGVGMAAGMLTNGPLLWDRLAVGVLAAWAIFAALGWFWDRLGVWGARRP